MPKQASYGASTPAGADRVRPALPWSQPLPCQDRGVPLTAGTPAGAEKAGYKAVMVTVDSPRTGNREAREAHLPSGRTWSTAICWTLPRLCRHMTRTRAALRLLRSSSSKALGWAGPSPVCCRQHAADLKLEHLLLWCILGRHPLERLQELRLHRLGSPAAVATWTTV